MLGMYVLRRRGAPTQVSLGWAPEGKRRPGRPKQTWRQAMLKRLTTSDVKSWNETAELARDRLTWQEMGKLISSTQRVTRHSANSSQVSHMHICIPICTMSVNFRA